MPNALSHILSSQTGQVVWEVDDSGDTIQTGTATIKGGVTGSLAVTGAVTVNGVPLNAEQPAVSGFTSWVFDPAAVVGSGSALVSGTLYLSTLTLNAPALISTLWVASANAQTVTANQCFVGIYGSDGTLLASADSSATVGTAGPHSYAVTPVNLATGSYWFAQLINFGGTALQMMAGNTTTNTRAIINGGLGAAQLRFAVNGTGLTALPTTITPASNSATGALSLWGAVA